MTICYINGSFKYKSDANVSIEDRGFNFSDGVYEVMSFYGQNVINFKKHLKRLNKSLETLQIKRPFTNIKTLELIIKKLLKINNLENGYIYLQITRGSAARNHIFPNKVEPNFIIFTFSVKYDQKLINNGVSIGLTDDQRWSRCDIKSISLLPNVLVKQRSLEKNLFESWQIRGKFITEGSTSNAFIINNKNQILTHPNNNFILGGVTRDSVIEIAKKNNFNVQEKPFAISDLKSCREAFLTSTTVKIIPVIKIDKKKINNGKPGKITKILIKKYNDFVSSQINE